MNSGDFSSMAMQQEPKNGGTYHRLLLKSSPFMAKLFRLVKHILIYPDIYIYIIILIEYVCYTHITEVYTASSTFCPRLAALPSELLRGVTLRVALRGIGKENATKFCGTTGLFWLFTVVNWKTIGKPLENGGLTVVHWMIYSLVHCN